MIPVRFRPLGAWSDADGPLAVAHSTFSAGHQATLDLLDRELHNLRARNIEIEVALVASQIRTSDGWPKMGSAQPTHPGVVLAFDGAHGRLRYATGRFTRWQDNLRAVAKGLKALRMVERYGITRGGEQYAGFRALPSGSGPDPARGRTLIDEHGSERAAQRATHPDAGGNARDFADVTAAIGIARAASQR